MFENRTAAGKILAEKFPQHLIQSDSLVVGIGLKGIPVACSFAASLRLPVDFVIARKIPLMGRPYIAIGAVTSDGTCEYDPLILRQTGMREDQLRNYARSVVEELRQELIRIRGAADPPHIGGRRVIIVDDGIASGHTMAAVIKCLKKQSVTSIIVAVPATSLFGYQKIRPQVDELFTLKICSERDFSVDALFEEEFGDRKAAEECIQTVKLLGLADYAQKF